MRRSTWSVPSIGGGLGTCPKHGTVETRRRYRRCMTTIDLAPRPPVTVSGVLDDPELAWRLCEANGPYPHVLLSLPEFAASLEAYKDAARRQSPDAVGVMVDDELMTMPIYRGDWASSRSVHIDGVDSVLHNE